MGGVGGREIYGGREVKVNTIYMMFEGRGGREGGVKGWGVRSTLYTWRFREGRGGLVGGKVNTIYGGRGGA